MELTPLDIRNQTFHTKRFGGFDPEEVKALVQGRLLSVGHAKVLLSLEDEKERILLARECVNDQLSVRALEKKVARLHAPVVVKQAGTPDLPEGYVKNLCDKLRKLLTDFFVCKCNAPTDRF